MCIGHTGAVYTGTSIQVSSALTVDTGHYYIINKQPSKRCDVVSVNVT